MATLEKLRNKAGVLVASVIGLSLLAFILGDFLSSGKALFSKQDNMVGQIAGENISYQDYLALVTQLEDNQKANTNQASVPEAQMEQLRDYAWKSLVEKYTIQKEIAKVGVSISPEELFDLVQGKNPSPLVSQYFTNPKTGEFDRNGVINFLKNMESNPKAKQAWLALEQEIIKSQLQNKYQTLISKGMYVTSLQAKEAVNDLDHKVSFTYVGKPYNSISDSSVAVSESEVKEYYKSHQSSYQQTASRDIDYLVFPIVPSQEDYAKAKETVDKLAPEFKASADPMQFVTLNSQRDDDKHFYKPSELDGQVAEFVKTAKQEDMLGPIFENDIYKFYRLADSKMISDSVKARQIVIRPDQNNQDAYNNAKSLADSLTLVIKKGGNFADIARKYSADDRTSANGGEIGWFKEVDNNPIVAACFNGKKGEVVSVEAQDGIHILQIEDKGPEVKKYKLATVEIDVVPSDRTYQDIYSKASKFVAEYNSLDKFEKASNEPKYSQQKRVANNIKENDKTIAGLDKPRDIIRWAFKSDKGDVSPVFELNDQFVVATLTAVRNDGTTPLESVKNEIEYQVKKEKKGDLLAKQLIEASNGVTSIEVLASKLNLSPMDAANISFSSYIVPGAGIEPKLIAAVSIAEKDQMSKPVIGSNAVYMFKINQENNDSTMTVKDAQQRLIMMFGNFAYRSAAQAIEDAANIKDKRSKFF
ncbi:MAG TPA: SurA N-terminal domain-containing protein [Williamwhitmania sp.]|nr:SurA N-terminal domain-containing protein [Williamwhitmania sp.]